jgi:hypothetical protein
MWGGWHWRSLNLQYLREVMIMYEGELVESLYLCICTFVVSAEKPSGSSGLSSGPET